MRSLVLLALIAATPASAQIVGEHVYDDVPRVDRFRGGDSRLPGPGIRRDLGDVHDRIDDAREGGTISRREARAYRREARVIGHLANRYARDGLSPWEANELEFRARALRDAVTRPAAAQRSRSGG
jgi:hypothetical protein